MAKARPDGEVAVGFTAAIRAGGGASMQWSACLLPVSFSFTESKLHLHPVRIPEGRPKLRVQHFLGARFGVLSCGASAHWQASGQGILPRLPRAPFGNGWQVAVFRRSALLGDGAQRAGEDTRGVNEL